MREVVTVIAAAALSMLPALAREAPPNEELAKVIYEAEIGRAFQAFLASKSTPLETCNFVGFQTSCVKPRISQQDAKIIVQSATRRATELIGRRAAEMSKDYAEIHISIH